MYKLYYFATSAVGPFLPLLLRRRLARGKEDPSRLRERLGYAGQARPKGKLLWIHAASMGESASILPLIQKFLSKNAEWSVLVTSVTVTSAALLAQKLPPRAFHQYAPLDNPEVIKRFLAHWQPQMAVWVESELWPNMMMMARQAEIPVILANARMSERSCHRWQKVPKLAARLLSCFAAIYPQSEADKERFIALGATYPEMLGNLKYDTPALPVNEADLLSLKSQAGARPLWLAASTHAGEEEEIFKAQQQLKAQIPEILTVIVPRHAARGPEIAAMLRGQGAQTATRSASENIQETTEFYIADTMGELGLLYRLCPVVFVGGSLIPHGGQNILEALRLGCVVLTGPHTHNFAAIMAELEKAQAFVRINNASELADQTRDLIANSEKRKRLATGAETVLKRHGGALQKLYAKMEAFL